MIRTKPLCPRERLLPRMAGLLTDSHPESLPDIYPYIPVAKVFPECLK